MSNVRKIKHEGEELAHLDTAGNLIIKGKATIGSDVEIINDDDLVPKKMLDTKADLVDGKVPEEQLPSYVDDVMEFPTLDDFPAEGESDKIYITQDTNESYRWSGTRYIKISTNHLSLIELNEEDNSTTLVPPTNKWSRFYGLLDNITSTVLGIKLEVPSANIGDMTPGLISAHYLKHLFAAIETTQNNRDITLQFKDVEGTAHTGNDNAWDNKPFESVATIPAFDSTIGKAGLLTQDIIDELTNNFNELITALENRVGDNLQEAINELREEFNTIIDSLEIDCKVEILSRAEYDALNDIDKEKLYVVDDGELLHKGVRMCKDIQPLIRIDTKVLGAMPTMNTSPTQVMINGETVTATISYVANTNQYCILLDGGGVDLYGRTLLATNSNQIYIWQDKTLQGYGTFSGYYGFNDGLIDDILNTALRNGYFLDRDNKIWSISDIGAYQDDGTFKSSDPVAFERLYHLDGEYQYWNGTEFCKLVNVVPPEENDEHRPIYFGSYLTIVPEYQEAETLPDFYTITNDNMFRGLLSINVQTAEQYPVGTILMVNGITYRVATRTYTYTYEVLKTLLNGMQNVDGTNTYWDTITTTISNYLYWETFEAQTIIVPSVQNGYVMDDPNNASTFLKVVNGVTESVTDIADNVLYISIDTGTVYAFNKHTNSFVDLSTIGSGGTPAPTAKTGDVVLDDLSTIAIERYLADPTCIGTKQVEGIVCDPVKKTFVNIRFASEKYRTFYPYGTKRLYAQSYAINGRGKDMDSGKNNQIWNRLTDTLSDYNGNGYPLQQYFPGEYILLQAQSPYFVPAYNEIVPFYNDIFYTEIDGDISIFQKVRQTLDLDIYSWVADLVQISTAPSNQYGKALTISGKLVDNDIMLEGMGLIPLMGIYLTDGGNE